MSRRASALVPLTCSQFVAFLNAVSRGQPNAWDHLLAELAHENGHATPRTNGEACCNGQRACNGSARPEPDAQPEDEAQCAEAPAPRELSLRLADLRGNFDEALDQVIHEERPVVLYSASRTDPFGIEDDPPQAGRPLAIILPIGEYRALVRCAEEREERGQLLRNIADAAHRASA